MSKHVYIVEGSHEYGKLFRHLGWELVNRLDEADLVCFTGGSDVSPNLYGDAHHWSTGNNPHRDAKEKLLFQDAYYNGLPMVGICRGGQFLNVMSGGRMYQNVTGHAIMGTHEITDLQTGECVQVSSTHHQMMMPRAEAVLVASGGILSEREWYDCEIYRKDVSKENIEVVYYPNTNALCFQPHPEYNGVEYEGMKVYFNSLLKRYLNV